VRVADELNKDRHSDSAKTAGCCVI
jgi:hypothetical protein